MYGPVLYEHAAELLAPLHAAVRDGCVQALEQSRRTGEDLSELLGVEVAGHVWSYLPLFGAFYKHPKYAKEDEWRVVIPGPPVRVPLPSAGANQFFVAGDPPIGRVKIDLPPSCLRNVTFGPRYDHHRPEAAELRRLIDEAGIEVRLAR